MAYIDPHAELEEITRLGQVSESTVTAPCQPFESRVPFQLDPADFTDELQRQQDNGDAMNDDSPICSADRCDKCKELLSDSDDETCWQCLHPDCEDYPCQDCYEHAIDRAHDSMDMER